MRTPEQEAILQTNGKNEMTTDLKFYYNGIKDCGGKLHNCSYGIGGLLPKYPHATVSIYIKNDKIFASDLRVIFDVRHDSDYSDEYIRVLPDHPFYSDVLAAAQKFDHALMAARTKHQGRTK